MSITPGSYRPLTQVCSNKILTDVDVSDGYSLNTNPNPRPRIFSGKALWDTGAAASVITRHTAETLELSPAGQRELHTAGGVLPNQPTYVVNFYLGGDNVIEGLLVTECATEIEGFDIIIGMDVITQGDFAITGVGEPPNREMKMTFRMPGKRHIDYEAQLRMHSTPHEFCYCASGKPFSVCCGARHFVGKNGAVGSGFAAKIKAWFGLG